MTSKILFFLLCSLALVLTLLTAACHETAVGSTPMLLNGDILFQDSQSFQSEAIQLVTQSPWSHCGIVIYREGAPYVYEAVGQVKLTPLAEWIARGRDRKYVVKRLRNHKSVLTDATLEKMRRIGERYAGLPYDLRFEWSDDRIYCSELVWKIFDEGADIQLGRPQKLGEFDTSNPRVQQHVSERYPEGIPAEEPVVSPARIFDCDLLMTVNR